MHVDRRRLTARLSVHDNSRGGDKGSKQREMLANEKPDEKLKRHEKGFKEFLLNIILK